MTIDKVRAALENADRGFRMMGMSEECAERRTIKQALSELDGCVIVPVEPTVEMEQAGYLEANGSIPAVNKSGFVTDNGCCNIYRAMIAPYVKGE